MLIALVIIVVLVVVVAAMYNSLVQLRVRGDQAWSDIDVQLKRRYDLIPNLVETVKGYMGHERETLTRVTEMRSRAMGARSPGERAQAEGMLTEALKTLFAVAENYPQLRAIESFNQLQGTLKEIEEQIQLARRYYNGVVRDLNTKISVFPSNIIAGMFGFKLREFFEVTTAAEREPVAVKFDTGAK